MNSWMTIILVLTMLNNIRLLGGSRLVPLIHTVAIQGALLGLLPLFIQDPIRLHAVAIAVVTCVIKGLILPKMLLRAMREVKIKREIKPLVGFSPSLLFGLLALGMSAWVGLTLPLPGSGASPLLIPVAIFTILVGLFLITTRRTALTHIIGYLVFENGIFVLGVSLIAEQPLLVEMGILLDLFVAVFIMGVIVFQIQREFDNIDIYTISALTESEDIESKISENGANGERL